MGSGLGGASDIMEGVVDGVRNVVNNRRNVTAATESITLRAVFEEGMNMRDFNRKVKRIENKINNRPLAKLNANCFSFKVVNA
jgi:hypothetical protein